jgi:hypothetical protein
VSTDFTISYLALGAVAASVSAGFGLLFRLLIASKDQQITGWKGLYDTCRSESIRKDEIIWRLSGVASRSLEQVGRDP